MVVVQLPPQVREIIEERAETVGFAALKRAAAVLSEAYRDARATRDVKLPAADRAAAYLVTRMPATYAAAHTVLGEVRRLLEETPASLLDVGAGAGATALAAASRFPLERLTLIENDAELIEAGRQLVPWARWETGDLRHAASLPPHDLVLAGYVLGELREAEALESARHMWDAARTALVIIEPGTTRGFTLVRTVRDLLLSAGAHMLAPCPGEGPCPIAAPDWCHFGCRVERTSLHRRIKEGALGYEDEKFSYVALARDGSAAARGRIIRRPQHQPGLITLEVCSPSGIITERVPRRDRETFRAARHAGWGDPWR